MELATSMIGAGVLLIAVSAIAHATELAISPLLEESHR